MHNPRQWTLRTFQEWLRWPSENYSRRVLLLFVFTILAGGCGGGTSTAPVVTPPPPAGPVSLSGNVLTVDSANLTVTFTGAAVTSLTNKATGESYIAQSGSSWFVVNMLNPDSQTLAAGNWTLGTDPATTQTVGMITYTGSSQSASLTVGVDPNTNEIFVRASAQSTNPGLLSVFWGIFGFDFSSSRLVIPGQAGIYYARNTQPAAVGLDYPTHWEAGMVIYEAPKGSLLIYANDGAVPKFKGIRASRVNGNLDFGFEMFAVAPWQNAVNTPVFEWRMKGFSGNWKVPAAYYKSWWANVGPQSAVAAPQWTKQIRAVVTVAFLDIPTLQALPSQVVPASTLLYLVPWRLAGYDINYPDYTPAPEAKAYITLAHQLGFHVMLHTNLLGVSLTNPNYASLQPYQLLTPDSLNPIGWPFNLAPGEPLEFAYISPASVAFRQLWINNVQQAVQQLNPDALHLDAGGTIVNDGNGLINGQNSIQGMIQLQHEIQAAFPNLALGYESTTEINSPFIQFAQRWSENVQPHPISTYLLGDNTLFYGFLDQPSPDDHQFISYVTHYEGQGILPTARLASLTDFDATKPRMLQLLQQMSLWQTKQFVPDWGTDWGTSMFRYKSLVDGSTAEIDQTSNLVTLSIGGSTFYQRLINASNYATPLFIRNWPAYDNSSLDGLDPSDQNWLDTGVSRPDNVPHLSNVDPGEHLDNQTFVGPDFGLFNLDVNQVPSYDFIGNFYTATKGTMFLVPYLVYRGMIQGAVAETSSVIVGGKVYNSAIVMQPPYKLVLDGVVYTEFTVPLPNTDQVTFNFQVGISDSGIRKDPATFVVWINGSEAWRNYVGTGAWSPGSVDLSSFRGQTVKIRIISGPGPNNNPVDDYTCWGALRITTNETRPGSQFTLNMPPGTGNTAYIPGATAVPITGQDSAFQITLNIPGGLLAFSNKPPTLTLGSDLLDSPFTAFTNTFGGIPINVQPNQGAIMVNNLSLAGTVLPRVLLTNPPADGRVFLTWTGTLPTAASVLSFLYGLTDLPTGTTGSNPAYTGVDFLVFINGQQVFDQAVQTGGVNSGTVSLTPYAGQAVVIQLVVDADGTALYDSSIWSKVTVN